MTNIFMFDAGWLKDNGAEAPTDVGAKEEGYATHHTNGTGPFKLESRVPDSRTVLVRNEGWWDTPVHNLDRIEFTPITSAATRVAALLSGEIDLTNGAPLQDPAAQRPDEHPDLRSGLARGARLAQADRRVTPICPSPSPAPPTAM